MSYADRVRVVFLIDTTLAVASLEVEVPPNVSFGLHAEGATAARDGQLAFQVNRNYSGLFDRQLEPLVQDLEMRRLLQAALPDLATPHTEFLRRMLVTDDPALDRQLFERGLTSTGLDLKEGGQRRAVEEYSVAGTWLRRRKWFRSMLTWTDIVLGSLASIPGLGVAIDPLKEWKESVEAQLDVESGKRIKK